MYYRVFAMTDADIQPAELLEHMQRKGFDVKGHFRGDEEGWFEAELSLDGLPLALERFLAVEGDVRAQLNTWAAWVELQEDYPRREQMMQELISARQVFVIPLADEESEDSPLRKLCQEMCRYLAERTDGFYQVDEKGFFTKEGLLFLKE